MKIHLKNFPPEGRQFAGEDPADILDVADPGLRFETPVSYKFSATLTGHSLVVIGRLWTRVGITCVRCLRHTERHIEVADFVAHQEVTPTQDFADLTENLREDILLALPQNPLCNPNCRGLCPVCGQDLNEKPCSCAKRAAVPEDFRGGGTGTPWSALDQIKIVRK